VWQGVTLQGDLYHVFFSDFGSLSNSSCHVSTLGDTDTNLTFVVTCDYEGAETEPAATFYDTGDAVNVDYALVELLFFNSHFWLAALAAVRAIALLWAAALVSVLSHD
jgi:hypothetical protein